MAIERVVDVAFAAMQERSGHRARPRDPRFALVVGMKTVAAMTWLRVSDHAEEVRTGAFQREIGIMIARCLIRDPTVGLEVPAGQSV